MAGAAAGLTADDRVMIRHVALFERLTDPALERVLATAFLQTVPRGATLFLQDEPAKRFFLLLSGWVKLYRLSQDGVEAVVTIIGAGETFAEAAMFANGRFPVCAEAVETARVLTFTAPDFARCLTEDPHIAFGLLGSLSLRLRGLVHQIEQLHVHSTPQRVGAFFLRFCPPGAGNATFQLPLDKGLIAKRLGMQPETFSRALAKLRQVGVVTLGNSVTVDDLDRLRAYCAEDEDIAPAR